MKKLLCAGLSIAICASSAAMLSACGTASVNYSLSEDGTYYIVSSVSGSKSALKTYEIPSEYTDESTNVTLPVKEIGVQAFYGCTSLKYVTIPDTVTTIGGAAFMLCKLTGITIPESVTKISYSAFAMCTALTDVTIPENVITIEQNAFFGCSSMTTVYLKAKIEDLPYRAFGNSVVISSSQVYTDTSLTQVYLPSTLKKIHSQALYGNFITDVYFAGSEEEWQSVYFYEYVTDEETNEKKENVVDKEQMMSGVNIHFSVDF